jgi:hypothetical protein
LQAKKLSNILKLKPNHQLNLQKMCSFLFLTLRVRRLPSTKWACRPAVLVGLPPPLQLHCSWDKVNWTLSFLLLLITFRTQIASSAEDKLGKSLGTQTENAGRVFSFAVSSHHHTICLEEVPFILSFPKTDRAMGQTPEPSLGAESLPIFVSVSLCLCFSIPHASKPSKDLCLSLRDSV